MLKALLAFRSWFWRCPPRAVATPRTAPASVLRRPRSWPTRPTGSRLCCRTVGTVVIQLGRCGAGARRADPDLVRRGFYNGLKFHRVMPGFMAQAAIHTGTRHRGSTCPTSKPSSPPSPTCAGLSRPPAPKTPIRPTASSSSCFRQSVAVGQVHGVSAGSSKAGRGHRMRSASRRPCRPKSCARALVMRARRGRTCSNCTGASAAAPAGPSAAGDSEPVAARARDAAIHHREDGLLRDDG